MGELTLCNCSYLDIEEWNWNKKKNIEITDGLISDIYDSSIKIKSRGKVLDCSNCWIIPGLVDMHVHYTWSHEINTPDYPTKKEELLALSYNNLSELLRCGVTTCRDMGSFRFSAEWVKSELQNDYSVPDMITCGHVLTYPNGHLQEFAQEIKYIKDIKNAIINNKSAGAEFIKIASDPFDSEAVSRFPNPAFDESFLKEIVWVAKENGMSTACHTYPSPIGVTRALISGVRTIEHALPFNSAMECDKYPNVFFVPTFATAVDICGFEKIDNQLSIRNTASYLKAKEMTKVIDIGEVPKSILEWLDILLEIVPKGIHKNQNICTGSDAGCKGTDFSSLLREMMFLSAMGASNQQVLTYAITNPYKALGINDKEQIKKGFVADLVVLKENPLEDIISLTKSVAVIHRGNCIHTI